MYDCSSDTGLFCLLTNVGKSDSSLAGHISLQCSWLWRCLIGFNGYCQKDTAAQMQAGQCCVLSLFLSFLPYNESWSLNPQLWSSFSEDYSPRPPTRQLLLLLTTRRVTSPNAFWKRTQCWKIFAVPARKCSTLYISHGAWIVMSSVNALLELFRLFCGCWAKFCVDAIGSLDAEVRLSF